MQPVQLSRNEVHHHAQHDALNQAGAVAVLGVKGALPGRSAVSPHSPFLWLWTSPGGLRSRAGIFAFFLALEAVLPSGVIATVMHPRRFMNSYRAAARCEYTAKREREPETTGGL